MIVGPGVVSWHCLKQNVVGSRRYHKTLLLFFCDAVTAA